jgi:dihydrofolate reductase
MAVLFEISMSLDGYVAGPDPDTEDPLGRGGEQLHEWVVASSSWREAHGKEGGEKNADSDVAAESIARTGATIMGRRMFSGQEGPWGDEPFQGWWGDDPPFHHPVFVLTSHEREPLTLSDTTFTFVTDGIESALDQARAAAGDKDVKVAGGANVGRQYVNAGLVDEIDIHLAPVLLGGGARLFDDKPARLELVRVIQSPVVTHLRYRPVD